MNKHNSFKPSFQAILGVTKMTKVMLTGLAAALFALGCGPAIDINRVGPNVVDKSLFEGEWYFRSTVVDKQFATNAVFIGLEGGLERIRWEITEKQLIAHRSYEKIPGSDPTSPGDDNVLAIFPIDKHFDIRRDYNSVNGVEGNTIGENTIDRPWWERDFMRVDWSSNLAPTWDLSGLANATDAGDVRFKNTIDRNANNDPTYPWKVRISPEYIETTMDTFVTPDWRVCYYLDGMTTSCNSAMVKIKMSFKKVDATNDYVPLNYPDFSQTELGELVVAATEEPIFMSTPTTAGEFIPRSCMTEEVGPDGTGIFLVKQDAGVTRICNTDPFIGDDPTTCIDVEAKCANMEKLFYAVGPEDVGLECDASIHNPDDCFQFTLPIFSRFGFFRTDRFQEDRENGVTLTSRERLINRWNLWERSRDENGRPIPMALREPKPIIYYLNPEFPPDLIDAAKAMEVDWDTAFRSAVAAAKGVNIADVTEQLFEVRVNDCNPQNVKDFAEAHKLEDALRANGIDEVGLGNLQNACAVLEDASQKAHLEDASVPVFTWQQLGDLRYSFLNWTPKPELAGPLGYGPSAADPITGEIISANANMYGASVDTYANWGADIVQLINGEIAEGDVINGTNVRQHIEAVRSRWSQRVPAEAVKGFVRLFEGRTGFMSEEQYLRPVPLTSMNGNYDRFAESGLEEAFLIDSEMLRMFGGDGEAMRRGEITDEMIERARPSTWARQHVPYEQMIAANSARPDVMAERLGNLDKQPTDRSMLSAAGRIEELTDFLGRKNFCYLAQQVEPAIADLAARVAEDGLSREEVVKLIREQVFIGVGAHELGHTFGLRHNFEGSADSLNFFPEFWGLDGAGLDQNKQHLLAKNGARPRELMYSSIMDYHQRFNADWAGIGAYDKAAIKFGYAEMAEVFDETDGAEDDLFVARGWINSVFILNPYDLPRLVGGPNANAQVNQEYQSAINQYVDGDDTATMDIANNTTIPRRPENLYRRRDIPYRDMMRNELMMAFIGDITDKALLQNAGFLDDDGRLPKVTVPYSFCSDAYAWGGALTCNRYDMGITSSEITTNAGEMYEFYYPFNNFRRDRVLNPLYSWANSYMSRLYQRTYQPMLNAFRFFYYYRRSSLRIFPSVNDWANASLNGMNFFSRVLQTPEPGQYCKNGAGTYEPRSVTVGDCLEPITLGLDQGRIYNSNWDNQYDYQPVNIGHYWDKAIALQAMTDSNAFFFRDFSSFTNRGAFSIGYYRVFQPEMLKLFGGVMRGDTASYSARVTVDNNGDAVVNYTPFLTTDVYGQPIDNPPLAGDPIVPATSFQLKYWASVFGMLNLSSTLDQTMDFAQRARIVMAGSASDPVIDTDVVDPNDILNFTDPTSGLVYRSVAVDGQDLSVGFNLLRDAEDFKNNEWQAAKDALDALRETGTPEQIREAETAFQIRDQQLNDKVQIIDFVVTIGDWMEFPSSF